MKQFTLYFVNDILENLFFPHRHMITEVWCFHGLKTWLVSVGLEDVVKYVVKTVKYINKMQLAYTSVSWTMC